MIAAQPNRNIDISVGAGPGSGYTASPNPVSITVMDDDTAMVSISPVSAEVEEGNPVVFEVSLDRETAVAARVEVRYTPVNTRPFVVPADLVPEVVTFAPGDTSEQVSIVTSNNTNPDSDGMVTATLENPINLAIDSASASVKILDNELLVSIVTLADEASSASAAVSESDDVMLRLMFSKATNRNVQVNLGYEGLFDESLGLVSVVEVPTDVQEYQFSVLGINDEIAVQPPRAVSVRVDDGVGYSVLAGASSVELTVTNEDIATVSIFPITDTIQEGDDAVFEISLDRKTATSVVAGISLQSIDTVFITEEISSQPVNARIEAGQTTTRVVISTQDNNDQAGDGVLRALINLVEGSPLELDSVSANRQADVIILDSDAIVSLNASIGSDIFLRILTSESANHVRLFLNIPEVIFNRNQPFDVNLRYTGDVGALTGEFSSVSVDDIPRVVTVEAGSRRQHFSVPVVDDDIAAESDRIARIVVDSGFGYTGSPDSVAITVVDDDNATVTIEPVSPSVTEGDTIVLKVIRNLTMDKATSVQLRLTHDGDFFFAASNVSNELVFPRRENTQFIPRLNYRHKRDGRLYYFLDSPVSDVDAVGLRELRRSLNGGNEVSPIMATQEGEHVGSDDSRSTIFEDINEQKYALVLPTLKEIREFFTNDSGDLIRTIPAGWSQVPTANRFDADSRIDYWSATQDESIDSSD